MRFEFASNFRVKSFILLAGYLQIEISLFNSVIFILFLTFRFTVYHLFISCLFALHIIFSITQLISADASTTLDVSHQDLVSLCVSVFFCEPPRVCSIAFMCCFLSCSHITFLASSWRHANDLQVSAFCLHLYASYNIFRIVLDVFSSHFLDGQSF